MALNALKDSPKDPKPWWESAIVYQIYPRSFKDTNGDGVGDLRGILEGLDYLKSLHVGCLWLSPVFPSPMRDFGYDVKDYEGIDPLFGTLEDFDTLLTATHQLGMKLILDLVPNHTSDQHPWFIESRSDRDHDKRDWYVWRDPGMAGAPPNNWLSFFGGPAWTLDSASGQYYLHQFDSTQPELNYRHPAVLEAMLDNIRFWLERGVDGFRIDVIWLLIKDAGLRDEPLNPNWDGSNPHEQLLHIYTADQPEVHQIIRSFRALFDQYGERLIVGEIDLPPENLMAYYGLAGDECQLPFNFSLIHTPFEAQILRQTVRDYEARLPAGAWPNWVLGNHDRPRLATRIGAPKARLAQLLLLTLRGTPTCYYGDELGMLNGSIPKARIKDPQAINQPEVGEWIGRDPQRTPLPWTTGPNRGFAPPGADPWLPVGDETATPSIETQSRDLSSFLHFFRSLSALRQSEAALMKGDYREIAIDHDDIMAYERSFADQRFLIILHFGGTPVTVPLQDPEIPLKLRLSTHPRSIAASLDSPLTLAGYEGVILQYPISPMKGRRP